MPNFEAVEQKKNELIRKALGGSLFIAPSTAAVIDTLVDVDGTLAVLPAEYSDGGLMTDEGMRIARAVELSEITSFGRYEPTRSDVTSDIETLQVDFQETNKQTIGLFTGADPAALVPDATTGELIIDKPTRPSARVYRGLALSVDEGEGGEIYIGRFMPRLKVTNYADQAYAKADAAVQWGVTFQAQVDSTAGYSMRHFFAGPGWLALLADMGFPATP